MALLNPYCTVAQVRAHIRNADTSIVSDATIENAINAASRFIDEYKQRDYFLHDHSSTPLKVLKRDRWVLSEVLFLPYSPIISLTAVVVWGSTWTENTDFVRSLDGTCLYSLRAGAAGFPEWPIGDGADEWTVLTGVFGYGQSTSTDVPTGLPYTIQQAAIEIASNLSGYNQRDVVGLDGSRISLTDRSIPKVALDLLGPRPPMS